MSFRGLLDRATEGFLRMGKTAACLNTVEKGEGDFVVARGDNSEADAMVSGLGEGMESKGQIDWLKESSNLVNSINGAAVEVTSENNVLIRLLGQWISCHGRCNRLALGRERDCG